MTDSVSHHDSAADLARAIRAREISAVEALDQVLAREKRVNPPLNAVVTLNVEAARARAEAADEALAKGELWGPLHGLPITLKDTYDVVGLPTVCGDPSLRGYRPERNAIVTQRLLDAGSIVYGKTNVPRMAQDIQSYNSVFGTSNNPWDTTRTPGGSSGGAAAAVAAGLTSFELGSDIGGSIRTPAHWCGVYGHKPSWGIVPLQGHIPGPPGTRSEPDLAVGGPLARSAADLRLVLDVVAGAGPLERGGWKLQLPPSRREKLSDFRVACHLDDSFCPVDQATRSRLEGLARGIEQAGGQVDYEPALPATLEEQAALYNQLLNAVIGAGVPTKLYKRMRAGAAFYKWTGRGQSPIGEFLRAATASHKDWARAHEQREKLREGWAYFFERYDVLITPVTPTPAIPHDQAGTVLSRTIHVDGQPRPYRDQFLWIAAATSAKLPATVAPAGRTADGLPVGVQIIAPYLEDHSSIRFAELLAEAGLGGYERPPL